MKYIITIIVGILAGTLVSTRVFAHEPTVIDHYSNTSVQTPYTERVCRETSGAAEGALSGAIVGGIIADLLSGGDGDATAGGAIFGSIVGAGESSSKTVCENITKYRTTTQRTYSHSTIRFYHNGQDYHLRFTK